MTRWAAIVGDAQVRAGTPQDAVGGVIPARVVRPGTVAEVQAVVREAASAGAPLVASGRGAHLDVGAPPRRLDVLVRLDRLDRVLDHQAGDMTVTVEAGRPLDALAQALAAAGQWLPLDPPRPAATTVGGLVAANLSGPLRASQGTVRDLLIGVRVVDATAAVVSGGGRVVKNVAGYDLPKMHVGALGTLGVIVEATFKLRPRPAREEAVVLACRTVSAAAESALALRDLAVEPTWLELAGPGGLAEGPGEGCAVVVGFGGTAEETAHGCGLVREHATARGLRTVAVADGSALRSRLAHFAVEPAAAVLRAASLPGAVGDVVAAAMATERSARCLAQVASGVVRIAVADGAAVARLIGALRPGLEAAGGTLVVERAAATVAASVDVWGTPGAAFPLMRRLKSAFDPNAIFAPGRFVGGL